MKKNGKYIHVDLFAKSLVIKKEGVRVVIVSSDLVEVTTELVANSRKGHRYPG